MKHEQLLDTLAKCGYEAKYFDTKEEAAKYLSESLTDLKIVFGGSITLQEMGLFETLSEKNQVYWHWKNPDVTARRTAEKEADVYMTSANGLSETGEIVNIDGNGNRVANAMYGHDTIIYVIGENKIAPTLDEAMHRARNIAGPLNARRLNKKTPCTVGDVKCHDCKTAERICKIFSIIPRKPGEVNRLLIILVGEKLGY